MPAHIADILQAGPGQHPRGSLSSLLDKLPGSLSIGTVLAGGAGIPVGGAAGAAAAAASSSSSGGPAGGGLAGGGSIAAHQAKIAQWRTSMWVWLGPLLGFLYLISPFDLIPDIIPVIGWLDDLLVVYYIACSVYGVMRERGQFGGDQQQQGQQQQRPRQG
jgi:hypothetical protein